MNEWNSMRRRAYIVIAAVLIAGALVSFFVLSDARGRQSFAPSEVGRTTDTRSDEPLVPRVSIETKPSSAEPLQLTDSVSEIEPVTGPRISGVVLDETGDPVPGIQVYAYWALNDEFGYPLSISSANWTSFFQAVSQGRTHPLWKSICRRQTRTDREGAYAFGSLPDTEIQLQAVSDDYDLLSDGSMVRAWRVVGVPGDIINWTATLLYPVRVELEYTDAIAKPGTLLVTCAVGERIGRTFDARTLGNAKFLPGLQTFTAWNADFGLRSDPVEFDVSPAGGTIRLRLKELPRLEISVEFSGASLSTEFELLAQVPESEGRKTTEGTMLKQAPLSFCERAGVWARIDMPIGEYRVVLVCLDREITKLEVNYSGGRQKFVLTVPEPAAADCCVVTSDASAPGAGETLSVRYQSKYSTSASILWIKPGGPWLIQAPSGQRLETATGLIVSHSAWGSVSVEGSVGSGATIDVQFQRPCIVHFPSEGLGYTLSSSIRATLRMRSGQDVALSFDTTTAVQPGKWELHIESSRVFGGGSVSRLVELKPGSTARVEVPELVAVKFMFPPYDGDGALESRGRMIGTERLWGAPFRVAYLIPGEYTVEFKPDFGSAQTRTFTAAAAMTVDFTR
ncbi:MAG: hypothetical protein H6839_17965 [Planctomycetes bacterium]|nr:hypothetical protein [Planctomycetota bacterium]